MSGWTPVRIFVAAGLIVIAGIALADGRLLAALVQACLSAAVMFVAPSRLAPPTTKSIYDKIYQLYGLGGLFVLVAFTGPDTAVGTVAAMIASATSVALGTAMLAGIRKHP